MKLFRLEQKVILINMSPLHDRLLGEFLFYFEKCQLNKWINKFTDDQPRR